MITKPFTPLYVTTPDDERHEEPCPSDSHQPLPNSSHYSILNIADVKPYNTPVNPDIQSGAVSLSEYRRC